MNQNTALNNNVAGTCFISNIMTRATKDVALLKSKITRTSYD